MTRAEGRYSHAEGKETKALHECSHAAGFRAASTANRQFVWNGKNANYNAVGLIGTFNVNPENGPSGFYIGNESLCSIINGSGDSCASSACANLSA